jgi:hypothetical protein
MPNTPMLQIAMKSAGVFSNMSLKSSFVLSIMGDAYPDGQKRDKGDSGY